MRIGIYGGTFNPPHIGHVKAVNTAARQLLLDLLIIVPAGIPPHKALPDSTPPDDMRLYMIREAFKDTFNAIVSDIELYKDEPGYTIDTVNAIKRDYPGDELFLLVGTDMYLTLEEWKNTKSLLEAVTPAVFSRGADDKEKIFKYSQYLQSRYGVRTWVIENDAVEISSTELRQMLPLREGSGYITDTIYSYIIKYRLYGAKPDWDWLRKKAFSMLAPQRISHVAGCEEAALRLAERWRVDISDAREAAILHDITKRLAADENVKILEDYGYPAGKVEHAEEKLLHSKSGAVLAKTLFGVSDAVADAIMWHTTGRAKMSDLEKVIYLADYIEPTREFQGVDTLRSLAFMNMNEAMMMGLEMSIADMRAREIKPNTATFDALCDIRNDKTEGTHV